MVTFVTLTDLTDWSLVKHSAKTTKVWSKRRQKSFSSKIFQNFFFYSDDFPFIKAFFGNRTFSTSIVSCAILSCQWPLTLLDDHSTKIRSKQWNLSRGQFWVPVGHLKNLHSVKVFSGFTGSNSLMATCVTLIDLTDWSLVKKSAKTAKSVNESETAETEIEKLLFKNNFFYSDEFPFIKAFFGNITSNTSIVFCAIFSDLAGWS